MINNVDEVVSSDGYNGYNGPSVVDTKTAAHSGDEYHLHRNGLDSIADFILDKMLPVALVASTAYVGGSILFGEGAAAGAGAETGLGGSAAAAGAESYLPAITAGELGTAPVAGGLADMASAGLGTSAGGLGGVAGAVGGSMPVVTIPGVAGGAAGTSLGLGGTAALGAGAAAGLGAMASGGGSPNPPAPKVDPNDPSIPKVPITGALGAGAGLGLGGAAALGAGAGLGAGFLIDPANAGNSPEVNGKDPNAPLLGGLPAGIGSLLNGLGGLLGGNVDHIKAQQDEDWWKSQLDTLQGMYKPGTPEADLMEQKMRAKDAAAGRNSQYGVRAVDLASNLADKRANIMTSAGYQNMANAYRNRSSQDLNGLFGAVNSQGGWGNLINNGINGINTIAGLFSDKPSINVTPPTR